jgi:hypothetical protein
MAYLGNGIYDLTDVIKASANPQINYEGLYQDQMPNVITFNPFKAMTPGYTFSDLLPRYFDKNPDMASPSGKFYDDLKLRMDFERANQGLPLFNRYGDPNRVGRFENFNPRVGTITPFQPYESPAFLAKQNVNPYFQGIMNQAPIDFGRFEGITEETDIDDDTQDKVEETKTGIETLLSFLQNIPTPMNLIRGGLQGIQNFNQGLRSTDFGRSKTLAEYFQKRRERKQAERAQKAMPSVYESAKAQGFTNEKGGFSTDKADDAGTSLGSGQFSPQTSRGRSGY